MKLELFDFIENTINQFEMKKPSYEYVEGKLRELYSTLFMGNENRVVALSARIKESSSLKEKLIRNHFYLDYSTPEEAIDHLTDLIGITLQCRFIRNEHEIYEKLFDHFRRNPSGFSQCIHDPNVYLNLNMGQPQTQRNGFTIYRIDGYYMFNNERVNYELQIKSLVHNFWSDIEHEVVYKNPDFVMYDTFNKSMLGAIRDNLDVVDRQLEIMYNEISYQSQQAQIGMDEKGFKTFVARSVNELVNRKMKESLGFATDFKKCSAIIAQYVYVRDFVNGEHNRETMIDYLALLNYLNDSDLDFSQSIDLEKPFESKDPFCNRIGRYWESQMNVNFQWHVFFCMIFTIQPDNNLEDFVDFCEVIRILLIQPGWFADTFPEYSIEEGDNARDYMEDILAEALVSVDKIDIVHEDMLYECMLTFRKIVNRLGEEYSTYHMFEEDKVEIRSLLMREIRNVFA